MRSRRSCCSTAAFARPRCSRSRIEEIGARLEAVIAASDDSVAEDELRAFCLARLPRYMIPEKFIFRADLPKTSTGKTDRQALAAAAPRTTEEVLDE